MTPLFLAANLNRADCISLLLRAGADPNASMNGISALIMAASYGSRDAVCMLLEAGALVDVKTEWGWTAMDYAYTSRTFAAICPLLLRAGSELPKDFYYYVSGHELDLSEYPYLGSILGAGSFEAYERAHLAALAKTLSPKLAHLLPPELVRKVVEFYLHAGFYPFTPARVPVPAPTVTRRTRSGRAYGH